MLLEASQLTRRFGGLVAVSKLDLSVAEGQITGLIGPNGSGKTTAFNLITGALKPDGGQVRLAGEPITGLPPERVCQKGIARTFQLVRPFAHLSVWQNVLVGSLFGRIRVGARRERERACREALEFVGLLDRAELPASALALADLKRLELARALATRPRLLLLDELMAGLNPAEIKATMALIRKLRATGVSVLMVEHIVHVVAELCEHVVVLNVGEKIAEGPPQVVLRDERVVEAYLGEAVHA